MLSLRSFLVCFCLHFKGLFVCLGLGVLFFVFSGVFVVFLVFFFSLSAPKDGVVLSPFDKVIPRWGKLQNLS